MIRYSRGLNPQKYSISYGYAANGQYLSVIAGIELMLFVLLYCNNFYCHRKLRLFLLFKVMLFGTADLSFAVSFCAF